MHHLYSCCLRLSDDVQPWVFKSKISYVDKPTFGIISDRCKSLLHTLVVSSDMHVHIYVVKVNPMERFTLIDPLVLTPPEKAVVCAAYECSDEKGTRTLLALVTTSGSILIYNVSIIESKYSILNAVILQEITGGKMNIFIGVGTKKEHQLIDIKSYQIIHTSAQRSDKKSIHLTWPTERRSSWFCDSSLCKDFKVSVYESHFAAYHRILS